MSSSVQFLVGVEDPNEDPVKDVRVELWDAEGIRSAPFRSIEVDSNGEALFNVGEQEVIDFYGSRVERFYFKVVADSIISAWNGSASDVPVELTFANTKTDPASWNDDKHNVYENGILRVFDASEIYTITATGFYAVAHFASVDAVNERLRPLRNVRLDVEARDPGSGDTVARKSVDTNKDGRALIRFHSVLRVAAVELRWWQSRSTVPDRFLSDEMDSGEQIIDPPWLAVQEMSPNPVVLEPELGGELVVQDTDENTIEDAVVELHAHEETGKGPLLTLTTDDNGKGELAFDYRDINEFYGRHVDRFFFRVYDELGNQLISTEEDHVSSVPAPVPGMNHGIWSLRTSGGTFDDDTLTLVYDDRVGKKEFTGSIQVVSSDETPIARAVVELRDHEDMGKGPFRSLVSDENGIVNLMFTYSELIDFYGRYVDRFYFRVRKNDDVVISTVRDYPNVFDTDAPPESPVPEWLEEGVWSLSEDNFEESVTLVAYAKFAEVEIIEDSSDSPKASSYIQVFETVADPKDDNPIALEPLSEKGRANLRELAWTDDTDSEVPTLLSPGPFFFRFVREGREPIDLRAVDLPRERQFIQEEPNGNGNGDGSSSEPLVDSTGYWTPTSPAPATQKFKFRIERGRRLRVRGHLRDDETKTGVDRLRTYLFRNEGDLPENNVFVYAASHIGVHAISPVGEEAWEDPLNEVVMGVDTAPTGVSYYLWGLGSVSNVVASRNGTTLWMYDAAMEDARDLAIDKHGDVLIVGTPEEDDPEDDDSEPAVEKISRTEGPPTAEQAWTYGTEDNLDTVHAVAVDDDGNVYIGSVDGTVHKLDGNLDAETSDEDRRKWKFEGHIDGDDAYAVYSVAVDADGYAYTASEDGTVRKIDSDGSEVWRYKGHINGEDVDAVTAVAVDADGYVYTGSVDETVRKLDGTLPDSATDNDREVWISDDHDAVVTAVAVDPLGFTYSSSEDESVIKFDSDGNEVWTSNLDDGHSFFLDVVTYPGPYGAFPAIWHQFTREHAISSTSTSSTGAFSFSIPEPAFDPERTERLDSVLRFEDADGEPIQVREVVEDDPEDYDKDWLFKLDEEGVSVELETDSIDPPPEMVEYHLVGQLIDISGDDDVPLSGVSVRAIEVAADEVRAVTVTNQHGYFEVVWTEPHDPQAPFEREFEFEIQSADGLLDTIVDEQDIVVDDEHNDYEEPFVIEEEFVGSKWGSPPEIDSDEVIDIGRLTPGEYLKDFEPNQYDDNVDELLDDYSEFVTSVGQRKFLERVVQTSIAKHQSGQATEDDTPDDYPEGDPCRCEQCTSIFSHFAYLADLIEYAEERVELEGETGADDKDWAKALGQPIDDFPTKCETLDVEVPVARIAAEVLRYQILEETSISRTDLVEVTERYRKLAYAEILDYFGVPVSKMMEVPPEDSMLPRAEVARRALSRQLGIASTAGDDDVLYEFVLDLDAYIESDEALTERNLERLFGLRATEDETDLGGEDLPDPFENLDTPLLLDRQRERLLSVWTKYDQGEEKGSGPSMSDVPLIDPDIVSVGEVQNDSDANALLVGRRDNLDKKRADLYDVLDDDPSDTDANIFDALIDEVGLEKSDSDTLESWDDLESIVEKRKNEVPFRKQLEDYDLDVASLDLLTIVHDRIDADDPIKDEQWDRVIGHLLAAWKRSKFDQWMDEEQNQGIVIAPVNPDSEDGDPSGEFYLLDEVRQHEPAFDEIPEFQRPLVDMERRRRWEDVLRSRTEEWEKLERDLRKAVEKAETTALPVLRAALVDEIGQGDTHRQRAEWCTNEYLIDMRIDGSIRRSRVRQAVESIKTALYGVRVGTHTSSRVDLTLDDPFDFDEVWEWLGDYSSWKTAVSVQTYPENFLGAIPRRTKTSAFKTLEETLNHAPGAYAMSEDEFCEVADEYVHRFRNLSEGLEVTATCEAMLQDVESSLCSDTELGEERHFLLFGTVTEVREEGLDKEPQPEFMWSKVRERDNFQSDWTPLPLTHDQVNEIFGAVQWEEHVYIFYLHDDGAGRTEIAALVLDRKTMEWNTFEYGETPPMASTHHVAQQTDANTKPLLVVQGQHRINFTELTAHRPTELDWKTFPVHWIFAEWRRSHAQSQFGNSKIEVPDYGMGFSVPKNLELRWQVENMVFAFYTSEIFSVRAVQRVVGGSNEFGSMAVLSWGGDDQVLTVTIQVDDAYERWNERVDEYEDEFEEYESNPPQVQVSEDQPDWPRHAQGDSAVVDDIAGIIGEGKPAGALRTDSSLSIINVPPEGSAPTKVYRLNPDAADPFESVREEGSQSLDLDEGTPAAGSTIPPHSRVESADDSDGNGPYRIALSRSILDTTSTSNTHVDTIDIGEFEDSSSGLEEQRAIRVTPLTTFFVAAKIPRVLSPKQRDLRRNLLHAMLEDFQKRATNLGKWYAKEMFFFVPLLLAKKSSDAGHHRAALDWIRTVFEYDHPELGDEGFDPFIFPVEFIGSSSEEQEAVAEWLKDPLNPHAMAGVDEGAYEKYLVQEVVKIMIAAADDKFAQDTEASRSRAQQLYRRALELLEGAGLFVSKPEGCELAEFEETLLAEFDDDNADVVYAVDQAVFAEIMRTLGRIDDSEKRSEATDAVLQAIDDAEDSISEQLHDGLVEARSQAGEYEDDAIVTYSEMIDDDRDKRQIWFDHVSQWTDVKRKCDILGSRIKGVVDNNLPRLFGGDDFEEVGAESLHAFLSNVKNGEGPGRPGAGPMYQQPEYQSVSTDYFGHIFADSQQVMSSASPTAHPEFCTPPNPVFDMLQTKAETSLRKLRMGLTVRGNRRIPGPEMDPAKLAAQTGLSGQLSMFQPETSEFGIDSALATEVRYEVLLETTRRFVGVASQMESSYLAALKEYDSESYRLMTASHAAELMGARDDVNELRIQAAEQEIDVAREQIRAAEAKEEHYQEELEDRTSRLRRTISGISSFGKVAVAVAVGAKTGGAGGGVAASIAGGADLLGQARNYYRTRENLEFQRDAAQQEAKIAREQKEVRKTQREVAALERQIGQLEIEHAEEVLEFLETQFTSADFYAYLIEMYRKTYQAVLGFATAMAQLTERQLEFERQERLTRQIKDDYYEAVGEFSGEQVQIDGIGGTARLEEDIVRVENTAIQTLERRLNVSKTFSMLSLAPGELFALQQGGRLRFGPTLEMLDREYPGQYHRLIEDVNVSIVALTPPVGGIRASLWNDGLSKAYVDAKGEETIPITKRTSRIDFTGAERARGVFELDPQSEVLRPFEGIGIETEFVLELPPPANRWDLTTIQDVLITVDYTAKHSQTKYHKVTQSIEPVIDESRSVSLRSEFTDEWKKLIGCNLEDKQELPELVVELDDEHFRPNIEEMTASEVRLFILTDNVFGGDDAELDEIEVHLLYDDDFDDEESLEWDEDTWGIAREGVASNVTSSITLDGLPDIDSNWDDVSDELNDGISPTGAWIIHFPKEMDEEDSPIVDLLEDEELVDVMLVIDYQAEGPQWPSG